MADALDAVLNLVAQNRAQQQQQVDNFTNGMQTFIQAQQAAKQNQLGQLQVRAGLAQSGLQLNPDNSIQFNPGYINPNTQFQSLLQGQAAAQTAKNPQAYQMYSGLLNRVMGVGQSSSPAGVTAQALAQPQTGQSQGQDISPNVGMGGNPNLNQMLTIGQSSTTDPVTGITSTSQNQVNPAAQQVQSLAANQATAVGLANTEAAQAQSVLDEKRNTLSRMASLRAELSKGNAVGNGGFLNGIGSSEDNYKNANAPFGIGALREKPTMAEKAASLKELAQAGSLADVQPSTATFGESGAKRIGSLVNSPSGDLGNLNLTDAQFNGTAKAQLINAAQKSIGIQRYANTLKNPQDMSSLKDPQILAGINSQIGKITPQENAQINKMVNSTLGVKINPAIFTANAKAHGYSDADIQKYLKENQ